jgi:hypothetical protein
LQEKNAMASPTNSDDDERLALAFALAFRLLQLSSDDFEERIAQLPPEGSAPGNHISHPHTPTTNVTEDLALASRLSLLPSSDDSNEQVARLHRMGPASASEEAQPPTPPHESDEDDVEPVQVLAQLPADVFGAQVRGLNQRRVSRTAIEDGLASLLEAMSLVQVRMTPSLYLGNR